MKHLLPIVIFVVLVFLGFILGGFFYTNYHVDGHVEFQVQQMVSDRQGLETLHYISTTDGKTFRFDRQKVEWVGVRVGCKYSADEYLHIDSVPVIVNIQLLGCV